MLGELITVVAGALFGLVVHRLSHGPALGTFGDVLFGITGAFAARVMTDLALHTDSLSAAALPFVIAGAAALPAAVHVVTARLDENGSRRGAPRS